jgi:transcriptional regulator with XRE-family HTH domain
MGQGIRAVPAQRSIGDLTTANLRAEIARAGLTGAEFGRRMEWSKNTTGRKLTGRSPITVNELDRAATILGVSVSLLLAGAA